MQFARKGNSRVFKPRVILTPAHLCVPTIKICGILIAVQRESLVQRALRKGYEDCVKEAMSFMEEVVMEA